MKHNAAPFRRAAQRLRVGHVAMHDFDSAFAQRVGLVRRPRQRAYVRAVSKQPLRQRAAKKASRACNQNTLIC